MLREEFQGALTCSRHPQSFHEGTCSVQDSPDDLTLGPSPTCFSRRPITTSQSAWVIVWGVSYRVCRLKDQLVGGECGQHLGIQAGDIGD